MEKASVQIRPSSDFSDTLAAPLASEIDELAERSDSLEQRIASLNDSYETLKKREVELTEWRWVLRETGGFFDRVCDKSQQRDRYRPWRLIYKNRPTHIQKIFGSPSTTMKPHSFVTWSTMPPAAPTVILKVNRVSLR